MESARLYGRVTRICEADRVFYFVFSPKTGPDQIYHVHVPEGFDYLKVNERCTFNLCNIRQIKKNAEAWCWVYEADLMVNP